MGVVAAPAAPVRRSMRETILTLFPFLARVRLSALDGGLCVRAAGKFLHLAGDKGDPAAITTQDTGGYEYLQVVITAGAVSAVTLYRSAANGAASSWAPVATGPLPPVNGVTSGTAIALGPGSSKVTIAP